MPVGGLAPLNGTRSGAPGFGGRCLRVAMTRRAHVRAYADVPVADIGRTIGSKLGDYCPDPWGQSSIGPTNWSTIRHDAGGVSAVAGTLIVGWSQSTGKQLA